MYYYKFKFIYNEGQDLTKLYEEFSHFKNDIFAEMRYKELLDKIPYVITTSHWRDAMDNEGFKIHINALHKGIVACAGKVHYCDTLKLLYCDNVVTTTPQLVKNSNAVDCKSCLNKIQRSDFVYEVIWEHDSLFHQGKISIEINQYDIQILLFHEKTIDKTNITKIINNSEFYTSLKKFLDKMLNTDLENDYKIWIKE